MRTRLGQARCAPFEEPLINLTPLIDVVFVILIGFIMMAPLLEIDHLELANASSEATHESVAVQETSPIALHVRRDNSIWYEKKEVAIGDLPPLMREAKRHHPNATPQLFHDRKGYFETYQSVKNALEEAGFEKVDIVLNPG